MTSEHDAPVVHQPLPGRAVDRSAAYEALLRDLLGVVGAEVPDEADPRRWRHRVKRDLDVRPRRADRAHVERRLPPPPGRNPAELGE